MLTPVIALIACIQVVFVSAGHPDFITEEMMQIVRPDKERCMAEHGTTEEMIDKVNEGHLENNRAVTCYVACLFEAFSLIDEDGELEVEMMTSFIPEQFKAAAEELMETCAKLKGSDLCDTMYLMGKCVQEKRPELWFLL